MKKAVISKEVALNDLEKFIDTFVKKPVAKDKLEEIYPDVLDAIMDGHLSFDKDMVPTYKLKDPIKLEDGSVLISEIKFRTRIKPLTLRALAKGIDLQKDPMGLSLNMVAYITDQSMEMIDNYEKYDCDAIQQIATVFS